VLLATGAVIVGALIFAAVVNLVSTRKSATTAGPDLYVVGNADSLAGTVSRTGPLLFQDLLGNSRDIYVQHLGPQQEGGSETWRTFEAHAPGAPRRCVLHWDAVAKQFADPCNQRTYSADGAGLTSFPTSVDASGRVVVDLRQPQPPTTAPASTTAPEPVTTTVSPPPS
jgi:hypothetical protein